MLKSNVFHINKKDDLIYLTIPRFEETGLVRHLFSTKHGGLSQGMYGEMNLSFTNGDDEEAVEENFMKICKCIGIEVEDLVLSMQTHTNNVALVGNKDRGRGYKGKRRFQDVDGFVTNEKGIALVTVYADCVPLYFLDPVKAVIGLSHAGWRGTVQKIGQKTVQKMVGEYGSNPADILVAIGPSIGKCCYEVSEDVKIEVENNFERDIIDRLITPVNNGKYMLDLWEANKEVCMKAGVLAENVIITDLCTKCFCEDFHSHRATQGRRGNLAAVMALV